MTMKPRAAGAGGAGISRACGGLPSPQIARLRPCRKIRHPRRDLAGPKHGTDAGGERRSDAEDEVEGHGHLACLDKVQTH